jgi:hypothetical protein
MHTCPVCGYPKLEEPPRSPSGGGSYEICPSCGFQFGVDDDDKGITFVQARERWVGEGMKWSSRGMAAPRGWSAREQMAVLSGRKPKTTVKRKLTKKKQAH